MNPRPASAGRPCGTRPAPLRPALAALALAVALSGGGCGTEARPAKPPAKSPPSAELQMARRLRDEALYPEAVAAYDRALARNPRDGVALQEVVHLLIRGKRLKGARERADKIREKAPDLPAAYLAQALVAYADADRKKAQILLEKAVSLPPPGDPEFYLGSARLFAALARPTQGAEILQKARDRGIESAELLELLGKLNLRIPRPAAAEEALRALLAIRPDSADAHRYRGRALIMLNRDQEAEKEFREVERIDPGEPYALYYLGTLEMEKGNLREAQELLSRSLEKDALNPKAHYALGQVLFRLGKEAESKQEFAKHQALMDRLYHHKTGGMASGADPNLMATEFTDDEVEGMSGGAHSVRGGSARPAPGEAPAAGDRFFFTDVAQRLGINLHNASGSLAKDYITGSLGSGACWLDYNGDGRLDLFLVNGERTPAGPGPPPRDTLYAQGDDGRFHDVTEAAGIRDTGWGYGCAVGDVDNDGDPDLYVANHGPNALFLNQGNGTFKEVGAAAGVDDPGWSTSSAFADYDGDGALDLVVANYVNFDLANTPRPGENDFCRFLGMPVLCGPRGLPMARNHLYHNRGDGTFQDVTQRAGFHTDRGYYSLGVVWGDVDGDGDLDLYVATDSTPNLLYRNNGDGTFTDVALEAGVAYNDEGREQAGMGVDMADYDNDGDLDIVVTNYSQDVDTLYNQDSPGYFHDESYASGLGEPSLIYLGWGVGLVDLDNDGYRDIFVANGHTQPQIDHYDLGSRYRERNLLFANQGNGTFKEVGLHAGPGLALVTPSRAAAFADYDNDGDIDILVNNIDDLPTLLRNDTGNRSHWIGFKLVGTRCNRDAIGARVTLMGEKDVRMAEVHRGYSFLSSSDPRILFGLGTEDRQTVSEIRIRWPDGTRQVVRDLAVDRYHTIQEPGPPRR